MAAAAESSFEQGVRASSRAPFSVEHRNMLKMPTISQRRIVYDDIPTLLKWRNSSSFRDYCTKRKGAVTQAEFRRELQEDFWFDRCEQVLILVDGVPAGTAFSYRYNSLAKHVFASIFLDPQYRGRAIGLCALADFALGVFERFDLHKIYLETYSFNAGVVRLLRRLGLPLEGDFIDHCLHHGERHSLLTFAIYRARVAEILRRTKVWQRKCPVSENLIRCPVPNNEYGLWFSELDFTR
jgi:RimJ/RimL family protein N-acetyltransferase